MLKNIMKKLSEKSGFTMLESALTTIILSTALVASMSVMQNATSSAIAADFKTVASQLATDKIEEILADKSFRGYDYLSSSNYPVETMSNSYQGYTREVQLVEVGSDDLESAENGSGLMKVTVTVSWGDDENEAVTLSTVLSNTSQS